MQALKALLLNKDQGFAELNTEKLSSDQFNYHLKILIRQGLIQKTESGRYELTLSGKQLASLIDTDTSSYEKQPKTSVCLVIEKVEDNEKFILVQERLKQPYYGYRGFVAGKCRHGEKIVETAKRELMEEVGLEAEIELRAILREHVYNPTGELLEDKIFHIMHVTNPTGELKGTFDSGENKWMKLADLETIEPKFYDIDILYKLATEENEHFYHELDFTVEGF